VISSEPISNVKAQSSNKVRIPNVKNLDICLPTLPTGKQAQAGIEKSEISNLKLETFRSFKIGI
jgi:hypothetical protein